MSEYLERKGGRSTVDRKGVTHRKAILAVIVLLLGGLGLLAADFSIESETAHSSVPAAALPPPFAENIRVTDGTSPFPDQVEPYIVVDSGGRLFVGWKEAASHDGPGRRVGFAWSGDGGLTWSANTLMERQAPGRFQSDPWLVVDEFDRVYYSRLEYESGPFDGVTVSRTDDGGASWGPIVNVDDQPGFADKESMVSDGNGTLYIAYDDVDLPSEQASIRFTRSTDGGATWSPSSQVGDGPGGFVSPVIATRPNGTVYVAWWDWADGNILFSRSWDRGTTWDSPVRVNPTAGTAPFELANPWWNSLPSILADSQGRIHLAWPDQRLGDLDVVIARSEDDGATWSVPVRINEDRSREQRMVTLALGIDDILHAAWYDNRTGNLNVFYSNSSDGGGSWSGNARVTTVETSSQFVRPGDYLGLVVDGNGTAYVVWTDGRGEDLDIYFARSRPLEVVDVEAPSIEILSPEEGQTVTSTELTVSGTAQDNMGIDRVEISADSGTSWVRADGRTSWQGVLEVPLGEVEILARVLDISGNAAMASVRVNVAPPSFLPPETVFLIVLVVAIVSTVAILAWFLARRWRQ